MGLSVDQRLVIVEEKVKTLETLLAQVGERLKKLENLDEEGPH